MPQRDGSEAGGEQWCGMADEGGWEGPLAVVDGSRLALWCEKSVCYRQFGWGDRMLGGGALGMPGGGGWLIHTMCAALCLAWLGGEVLGWESGARINWA